MPQSIPHFNLFKGKDGKHYFNMVGTNSKIILQSEGYESRQKARNGIKAIFNACNDYPLSIEVIK